MRMMELVIHATVVGTAAAAFAWWGHRFSLQFERGQKWDGYAPGLQPGKLLGRRVDLSDIQWREFRAGLPAMAALFIAAAAVSRLLQRSGASPAGRARCYLAISLAFLGYLHGACTAFVLLSALTSFAAAQAAAGRRHGTAAIWACNLGLLLAARLGEGFRFAWLGSLLGPLDSHRGAVRWEICFNLSVLRMLSYALDLHCRRRRLASLAAASPPPRQPSAVAASPPRSAPSAVAAVGPYGVAAASNKAGDSDAASKKAGDSDAAANKAGDSGIDGAAAAARWRQQSALPEAGDYSLLPFLAHVLYAPLYLAGPIITFQDFAWQLRQGGRQGAAPSGRTVLRYAARFLADWACLELLTRCLFFNSIAKYRIGLRYRQYGLQYGAVEMAMTAFWVLCFMWLKFATIWRFFRLAALLDGINPPENMRRCFANNYDLEGFWRGWHSSFNQWLVRYLYVPLGGSRRRALAIWPIFFFVAVWHDLEWRLLSWAWLVCLAFLPEMAAKGLARSPRMDSWRHTMVFRHVCAAAAALNIAALMAANLAGFVVGLDGLKGLLPEMLGNRRFVAATLVTFWSAANLQFWIREQEAKRGSTGGSKGAGGGGLAAAAAGARDGRHHAGQ